MFPTVAGYAKTPKTKRMALPSSTPVDGRTTTAQGKFLRVQLLCLALIGVQRHETVSSRAIFHVCFISMVIMDLATILFALEHANDIALVCDCLGPTFTAYLGIVKQYCLSAHRVELWNIIETLRRLKDYGE